MPTSHRQSVPLFAKIFGEFAAVKQADDSVRPQNARLFSEILGEFVTSQRADVGIGPYDHVRGCVQIRQTLLFDIIVSNSRKSAYGHIFISAHARFLAKICDYS